MFSILKYDARQSLTTMDVIAVLLILAVALGFVQYYVYEYKKTLEQKPIFQDVERNKVDHFTNYRQYGFYGFRLLFLPNPLSILFMNSTILHDMTAYIDSGERLNIYQSLKSRTPFGANQYLFADFSGIFLFFGVLLMLFYGYKLFLSVEYLRHLASIAGSKKLFTKIFVSRAIMAALFSLLFLVPAVLLITINGVAVSVDKYLVVLFLKMFCISLTFLLFGFVFGLSKSIFKGLAGAVISWILLLLIIPFLVSFIVTATSGSIKPENQLEIEKLKLMMDFEKSSNEKAGILEINKQPGDIDRELVDSYYKNQFQKIQALEMELKAQMQAHTDFYYKLSSIFPTTSYLALTQEISSNGYENLYAFYQTVIKIKEAFFKEYMKKVYFSSSSEPPKVEPFLKGDDNIIEGKPALPGYLLLGFFFNLLWIAALAMIAYPRFKKNLCDLPEKEKDAPEPKDIKVKRGKLKSWRVSGNLFKNQLLTLLFNVPEEFIKKGYTYRVFIDDQELNTAKKRQKFLYLCHPKAIPGHFKVGSFLTLIMDLMNTVADKRKEIIARFSLEAAWKKKFRKLNIEELGNVFLAILELKNFDIYLIDDIGKDMLLDFCFALKDKMVSLAESNGAAVLFLTTEVSYVKTAKEKLLSFYECNGWVNTIESLQDSPAAAGAAPREE